MKASRKRWALSSLFHPIANEPGVDYDAEPYELAGVQQEVHVLPRSDQLNDPATVAILLRPSESASAMVDATFHTAPNIESDGNRNVESPGQDIYQGNVPFDNAAAYTFLPNPNVESGVPDHPQMSSIRAQFEAALERVQDHLMGAP
jgi:hypothetical protein